MTPNEVDFLIDSVCDDYSAHDLGNDAIIVPELQELLELEVPLLQLIIRAARELTRIRGDGLPQWALYYQVH